MTTENSKQIQLLYQQIQQLCLKKMALTKYEKEDTEAYSNLLHTCFNLSKKAKSSKNNQMQSLIKKDYLLSLFEDGYELGYKLIDFNSKQLDISLHNNQAHFAIWQPESNPYAQLQNSIDNNKKPQTMDTLLLFKQIKKILKQNQDSQKTIKEIKNLLNQNQVKL